MRGKEKVREGERAKRSRGRGQREGDRERKRVRDTQCHNAKLKKSYMYT